MVLGLYKCHNLKFVYIYIYMNIFTCCALVYLKHNRRGNNIMSVVVLGE